jgi:hypothetical protein
MRWSTPTFLYIALAAAICPSAFAQRGFGAGSRGSGGAAIPSSTAFGMGANISGRASPPSSTAIGAGSPVRSSFPRGTGYHGSTRNSGRAGYGYSYRRDYRNVPFAYFLNPYYYPFLDYGSAPYGGAPQDGYYDPSADNDLVAQNLLADQVQRLTAEVDQMRYAQQGQQGPYMQQPYMQAPPTAQNTEPPAIPLTVVLRNGQRLQVENYAVIDQTFWDFSKQPARKIPISSIDVSASSQATAANGGEFPQLDSK